MTLRVTAIISAIVAVVASLLTASPAQARSYDSFVKTKNVAISSSGNGKVAVQCKAKRTCRGKISFTRDTGKPRARSYSVPAGQTKYVSVAMHKNAPVNPHNARAVSGRSYKSVSRVKLRVAETSPRRKTHHYNRIVTETPVTRQTFSGRVTGLGTNLARDVRVDLVKTTRGGNTVVVKGQDVTRNGGSYSLSVKLGANNSTSPAYRLRVSGIDQSGAKRSWYWRGKSGRATGGGAHLRDASTVRATKTSTFRADFTYSSIAGTTSPGAEITVAAPPPSFKGGAVVRRELDIPSCANYFGGAKANGSGAYSVGFLPATASSNNRYMVGVRKGSVQAWYGKTGTRYGSCHHVTKYAKKRSNLITLRGPVTGKSLGVGASGNTVTVRAKFSSAYKPTGQGDRWVTLREKIPGLKVLDSPVVEAGAANSKGMRKFQNVRPGKYWVEVGRRTGCSDWYPSRYTNNRKYFKGLDRAAEKWKSFRRLRDLPGNANRGYERIARNVEPNPARGTVHNKVRKGYAGWMYRGVCKARGAGVVNTLTVSGTNRNISKSTSRNAQGALVKGKITRTGGRTNKEMMVTLSSTSGTKIVRTALTDSKGVFYVAGLSSGRWRITVNADSWRGIGRDFSGRKTVKVKAGKGYNVGTLKFKS